MSDEDDMQPITRKELREELAQFHAVLRTIVERMVTKEDLASTNARVDGVISRMATKDDLLAQRNDTAQDIGRAVNSAFEQFRFWFKTLDEKSSDVHPRLVALEQSPPQDPSPKRVTRKRKRAA